MRAAVRPETQVLRPALPRRARAETASPAVALHPLTEVVLELKISHRLTTDLNSASLTGRCSAARRGRSRHAVRTAARRRSDHFGRPAWGRQLCLTLLCEVGELPEDAPSLNGVAIGHWNEAGARTDPLVSTVTAALGGRNVRATAEERTEPSSNGNALLVSEALARAPFPGQSPEHRPCPIPPGSRRPHLLRRRRPHPHPPEGRPKAARVEAGRTGPQFPEVSRRREPSPAGGRGHGMPPMRSARCRASSSHRLSEPISRTDSFTVRSGEKPLTRRMMPIREHTAARSRGPRPTTGPEPDSAGRCSR